MFPKLKKCMPFVLVILLEIKFYSMKLESYITEKKKKKEGIKHVPIGNS